MGRRPEFAGGGLIRSFGGWDEEGKGTGAYAVPEVTLGEQSVDFAKIGISDNFCNGRHIGPELVKLTGQKTVSAKREVIRSLYIRQEKRFDE